MSTLAESFQHNVNACFVGPVSHYILCKQACTFRGGKLPLGKEKLSQSDFPEPKLQNMSTAGRGPDPPTQGRASTLRPMEVTRRAPNFRCEKLALCLAPEK